MHELCEIRTDNYDSFNWKQALFGKRIPKKFVRKKSKSKFGTFCMALCSGLIKLSAMTKCSATNNCHESSKVKHSKIWDERLQAIRCPKHPLLSQWESSNVACALKALAMADASRWISSLSPSAGSPLTYQIPPTYRPPGLILGAYVAYPVWHLSQVCACEKERK